MAMTATLGLRTLLTWLADRLIACLTIRIDLGGLRVNEREVLEDLGFGRT